MFIVGKAKQENELWLRLIDWLTGVGWIGTGDLHPDNVGNGVIRDLRIHDDYLKYRFELELITEQQHGGVFAVTMVNLEDGTSTPLPSAQTNEVYEHVIGLDTVIQFYLDFDSVDWAIKPAGGVATAVVTPGFEGSGYSVGDLIDITDFGGGAGSGTGLVLEVASEVGGAIATVTVSEPGEGYLDTDTEVYGTVSPPGGTGARFDITSVLPAIPDRITIHATDKILIDEIGNNNANAPVIENITKVDDSMSTQAITLTCTKQSGAQASNVLVFFTSASTLDEWVNIPEYIEITSLLNVEDAGGGTTYTAGDDYEVDLDGGRFRASTGKKIDTIAINNGGSGWAVGDQIQVTGGSGSDAILEVAGESGGAITSVTIIDGGKNYEATDLNVANSAIAPATGIGFQFDITAVTPLGTIPVDHNLQGNINSPFHPAEFDVVGDVSGPLGSYTQNANASYVFGGFKLPNPSPTSDVTQGIYVGDVFTVHYRENELREVNQEWEAFKTEGTWGVTQDQFGQVGGIGLRSFDANHLTLRGQGTAGLDDIYVSMEREFDNINEWACWKLYGMRDYDNSLVFEEQEGLTKGSWFSSQWSNPIMQFWSAEMPYWIIADGERFIVASFSNQSYMQCYLGFYQQYDYPSVNPYPLFVGGSGVELEKNWGTASVFNSNFWNHINNSSSSIREQNCAAEVWEGLGDSRRCWNAEAEGVASNNWHDEDDDRVIHPWNSFQMYRTIKNIDGSYPLFRAKVGRHSGTLKGVYATSGREAQQPENILYDPVNNKKYVVMHNHNRTDFWNYCALELS